MEEVEYNSCCCLSQSSCFISQAILMGVEKCGSMGEATRELEALRIADLGVSCTNECSRQLDTPAFASRAYQVEERSRSGALQTEEWALLSFW